MASCDCNRKKDIIEKNCPLCKGRSKNINYMAVRFVVKNELQKFVQNDGYYICNNRDCDVVFFNEEENLIFLTRDINMTADFSRVSGQGKDCCKAGCKG